MALCFHEPVLPVLYRHLAHSAASSSYCQKRALAAQQAQQASNPHQAKRRKVDEQGQRRKPPSAPPQQHQQPIAGPSRFNVGAALLPTAGVIGKQYVPAPPVKRKAAAKTEDDDDVLIISDSSDCNNAARKRPKSTSAGAPSGSSHNQVQRSKPTAGQAATRPQTPAKRPHDVIELSSDGEVMEILAITKKVRLSLFMHLFDVFIG